MPGTFRTLVVALTVVLAGCAGSGYAPAEAGDAPATPAEATTSPANAAAPPENADAAGGTGESLPPGVTEEGVTDAWALAQAHGRILENTSFTMARTETRREANGSLFSQRTVTTRVGGADPADGLFAVVRWGGDPPHVAGDLRRVELYSNGTQTVRAAFLADGTADYAVLDRGLDALPSTRPVTLSRDALFTVFNTAETDLVERIERDDRTLYRLVATGGPSEGRWERTENFAFTALVDGDGLVHEFHLSMTTNLRSLAETDDDRPIHLTRTVRFVDVGSTTVERPPWFEEAMANETADA